MSDRKTNTEDRAAAWATYRKAGDLLAAAVIAVMRRCGAANGATPPTTWRTLDPKHGVGVARTAEGGWRLSLVQPNSDGRMTHVTLTAEQMRAVARIVPGWGEEQRGYVRAQVQHVVLPSPDSEGGA